MSPGVREEHSAKSAAALVTSGERSPLEQLLHGLNQPLTGLQCSMEVALASPRTPEQYVHGLREGLELTERMRALVEAIREVAEVEGETNTNKEPETIELAALLREVVDELNPVAEVKGVRITLDGSAEFYAWVRAGRRRLSSLAFRMLESVLSAADRGSAMQIEMSGVAEVAADVTGAWVRIRWHSGKQQGEFSRPGLGLLVAQAGWESVGAKWERERAENLETVMVWLRGVPASRNS